MVEDAAAFELVFFARRSFEARAASGAGFKAIVELSITAKISRNNRATSSSRAEKWGKRFLRPSVPACSRAPPTIVKRTDAAWRTLVPWRAIPDGDTPVAHLQGRSTAMPTAKKRINITVDDDVYGALERLSAKRDQSVAGVGLSLIEEALEYQEDLHFSRVADERLAKKEKRITHARAWD